MSKAGINSRREILSGLPRFDAFVTTDQKLLVCWSALPLTCIPQFGRVDLMHIKPIPPVPGFHGQMNIDDLILFSNTSPLASIHRMWSALTRYALMIDRTHAKALEGICEFLNTAQPPVDEDELDRIALAHMEHEILSDSDSYIVKSLLFLSLVAFNEFALKQLYKVLDPPGDPLPPRGAVTVIKNTLAARGLLNDLPESYQRDFQEHIEPVRNNFAHGDWTDLGKPLASVDLTSAYMAVAQFFLVVQENLAQKRFRV